MLVPDAQALAQWIWATVWLIKVLLETCTENESGHQLVYEEFNLQDGILKQWRLSVHAIGVA